MGVAEDQKAKELVLGVLQDTSLDKINFTLGRANVSSSSYSRVSEAIRTGKITVLYEAGLAQGAATRAHYVHRLFLPNGIEICDLIVVGFTDLGGTLPDEFVRRSLIVHECTHALFDLLKTPMTELEHEAAAYVAGAMFGLAKLSEQGRPTDRDPDDPLHKAAWDLARHLQAGLPKGPDWWIGRIAKWLALLSAIVARYRPDIDQNIPGHDGMGREPGPPSPPLRPH